MAANFKVFVDGNRLPAEDINNFLAKQCVVQVDGQNDLAPLTEYGVRMAMTLDTGALWFYTDLGGWSPLEIDGLLTLDEADERYLTQLTAEGLFLTKTEGADFLTEDEIATTYLAKLTAEGLYLSQTDAQQNYLGKTEAAQTYLTQLTAQGLYITASDANNTFLTQSEANNLYLTPQDANNTYLTLVSAGQVYLRQDTANSVYQTKPSSGTFITDISAGSLFISKTDNAGTYVTSIDGGVITTGSIDANRITANTVLTSARIQTSDTGKRVLISNSSDSIVFYNSSGTITGRIQAGVAGTVLDIKGVNGTAGLEIGSASTVVDGNLSTSGTANIIAAGRCGQVTFSAASGTTTAVYRNSTTRLFQPTSSDERLKKNITTFEGGLDLVKQLRPVKFQFKSEEDGPVSYGLIAQEVQPLVDANDNVVNVMDADEEGNEYLSVEYISFIAPLISAVKELSAKNEELEARLAALEGGNS